MVDVALEPEFEHEQGPEFLALVVLAGVVLGEEAAEGVGSEELAGQGAVGQDGVAEEVAQVGAEPLAYGYGEALFGAICGVVGEQVGAGVSEDAFADAAVVSVGGGQGGGQFE